MNSIINLDSELKKFYWHSTIKKKILEFKLKLSSKHTHIRIENIKDLIRFLINLTEIEEESGDEGEGSLQSLSMTQFDEDLNLVRISINLLEDYSPLNSIKKCSDLPENLWLKQTIYTLELIQGLCLILPKQTLLSLSILNQNFLKLILNYFKINFSNLKICCLETFQCILILNNEFIRNFEELGGIEEIIHLLKLQSTFREVRLKCVEFLYQYILPETNISKNSKNQSNIESIKSSEDKMNYIASELGLDFVQNLLIPLNSNQ